MGLFFVFLCQKDNNSMQRTPLRGAADAERYAAQLLILGIIRYCLDSSMIP